MGLWKLNEKDPGARASNPACSPLVDARPSGAGADVERV
jgi:hypothetical protein